MMTQTDIAIHNKQGWKSWDSEQAQPSYRTSIQDKETTHRMANSSRKHPRAYQSIRDYYALWTLVEEEFS